MELSPYVEGLRRELGSLTRFASDDVVQVAGKLAEALESSVRLTLLEVLSAAAAEITTRLDDAVIEVRLSGSEPEFVVTTTAAPPPEEPAGADPGEASDDMTRITLRLPGPLKARVDAEAAAASQSVNAWLVRAIARALDQAPAGASRGRRMPGAG